MGIRLDKKYMGVMFPCSEDHLAGKIDAYSEAWPD
jgi:hypothetical protein